MIDAGIRFAAEFALAVAIAWALRTYVFAFTWVKGNSMNPTLKNGEVLFVVMRRFRRQPLRRGDVVVCHYPGRGRKYFIKRIVGMPGDTVSRVAGVTMINGQSLDARASLWRSEYAHVLGEEEYFCVGDNRVSSHDSRDWMRAGGNQVGPVSRRMICGVAKYVLLPVGKRRAVGSTYMFEGVQPVIAPEPPVDEGDTHEFQEKGTD